MQFWRKCENFAKRSDIMSLKSKMALEYNIELLVRNMPKGHDICFWTFTLPVKLYPVEGARMWGDLCRELRRSLGFYGVRVFELHPSGHGLHVHVLTSSFFRIQDVLPICRRFGWGRVGVETWDICETDRAVAYMSKYLGKQGGKKSWAGMLRGIRWWSVFGKVEDKVRVKDVKCKSFFGAIWDLLPYEFVTHFVRCSRPIPGDARSNRSYNFRKLLLVRSVYNAAKGVMTDFLWHIRRQAWYETQSTPYTTVGVDYGIC